MIPEIPKKIKLW